MGVKKNLIVVLAMSAYIIASLCFGVIPTALIYTFVVLPTVYFAVRIYLWIRSRRELDLRTGILIGEITVGLTLDGKEILKRDC